MKNDPFNMLMVIRTIIVASLTLSILMNATYMVIDPVAAKSDDPPDQDGSILIDFKDPAYTINATQYSLPLSSVPIGTRLPDRYLNQSQARYLREHGFVNAGRSDYYDLVPLYNELYEEEVPIYITTDSVLHIYHILFDSVLSSVEEKFLYSSLVEMTRYLIEYTTWQYDNVSGTCTFDHFYNTTDNHGNEKSYMIEETIDLKKAALYNMAYLSVALRLLDPNATIPAKASALSTKELNLINNASGITNSPIFDKRDVHYILEYQEDYSQYIPRGHYTRSEKLGRFFKAMMWYGRMSFRAKSAQETVQAILLTDAMMRAGQGSANPLNKWGSIYGTLSFFVGEADDPTPIDYSRISSSVLGGLGNTYSILLKDPYLSKFRENVSQLDKPLICSGYYIASRESGYDALMGLRLLGQRFTPDSQLFTKLVYPEVGLHTGTGDPFTMTNVIDFGHTKGLPRGFEVMAALGSEMAEDYIIEGGDHEYEGYGDKFGIMKSRFNNYNSSVWGSSLYYGWLYSLKPLARNFSAQNYPTFMRDRNYQAQKLNTMLGSWTALRHDTILHVKQSYSGGGMSGHNQKGLVEPIPELYSRLFHLTNSTRSGLKVMGIMPSDLDDNLLSFMNMASRLGNIAVLELKGQDPTTSDHSYIKHISGTMGGILAGIPQERYDARIVADVHTDPNPTAEDARCLEEATGYFDYIVIAFKDGSGAMQYAVGPVYSYYEFTKPISNRLSDESWRSILDDGTDVPEQFDWMDVPPRSGGIDFDIRDVGIGSDDIRIRMPLWPYNGTISVEGVVTNFGEVDAVVAITLTFSSPTRSYCLFSVEKQIGCGDRFIWKTYWNVIKEGAVDQRFTVKVEMKNDEDMFPQNNIASIVFSPSDIKDRDWDGVLDEADAFPDDPAASIDTDGDGYPDRWNDGCTEEDSTTGLSLDAFPDDPGEWKDSDGDGVGDNSDAFPNDPFHSKDSDRDGVPDEIDDYPFDPAACRDSDGDGYPDAWNPGKSQSDSTSDLQLDMFPEDPSEWKDSDGDGIGDNKDAFPTDRSASVDSDGDGYPDRWNPRCDELDSILGLTLDVFPHDPTEWNDTDGDGVGDNSDRFPTDPSEWKDSDGDGIGDNSDAFPFDPSASLDFDRDGYPDEWNPGMSEKDSSTGLMLDAFPYDPAAALDSDGDGYPDRWNPGKDRRGSTLRLRLDAFPFDPMEWSDMDNDGVGDRSDHFPTDPAASIDTDHDRYPDRWNDGMSQADSTMGLMLDAFPYDPAAAIDSDGDGYPDRWNPGKYSRDSTMKLMLDAYPLDPAAAIDSDGDGYPDRWNDGMSERDSTTGLVLDKFPNDPTRWSDRVDRGVMSSEDIILVSLMMILMIELVFTSVVISILIVRKRSMADDDWTDAEIME